MPKLAHPVLSAKIAHKLIWAIQSGATHSLAISQRLNKAQGTVAEQLYVLKDLGFLETKKVKQAVIYSVNWKKIFEVWEEEILFIFEEQHYEDSSKQDYADFKKDINSFFESAEFLEFLKNYLLETGRIGVDESLKTIMTYTLLEGISELRNRTYFEEPARSKSNLFFQLERLHAILDPFGSNAFEAVDVSFKKTLGEIK